MDTIYPGPDTGLSHCVTPHLSVKPEFCSGGIKVSNMALSSVSVCSRSGGVGEIRTKKADEVVGPVVGKKMKGSGAGVHSLMGGEAAVC